MTSDLFARARANIDRFTIETLFGPGEWKNDEFYCLNPLRTDARVGSFSIKSSGQYYDFSTNEGGDFIDLYSKVKRLPQYKPHEYWLESQNQKYKQKKHRSTPSHTLILMNMKS